MQFERASRRARLAPRRNRRTTRGRARPSALTSSLDRWVIGRSARLRPSPADRALRTLSAGANYNRLWLGFGAAMVLLGSGPVRRAGVRGLLATGLASGVANGIAKPLFPRRRPPDESVPFVRRLGTPPVSSSFPSGHSASAAAFVTGVALESPATAVAVAPVAVAVGYSRVHIGVHWPSDVVAGALLGAGVALGTRRWWALRPDEPALVGENERIEPLPHGRGLLLVANALSGSGAAEEVLAEVRSALPAARIVPFDHERTLDEQLAEHLNSGQVRALGVLGGDGTVSGVAEIAVREQLPLAVFAGGTLNHFAKDAGVDDADHTASALDAGAVARVDVAAVDLDGGGERVFVNTASLGGYPDFVHLRERWEHRIGKWPAAGIAMVRVLLRAEPLHATVDGVPMALWMLFVGNGRYSPADQIPMSRPELHRGTIDVRYLRADVPFSRTRLVWATLTGTLADSATYVRRAAERLEVRISSGPVSLATDGEVGYRGTEFAFTSRPGALRIFRRPDEADAGGHASRAEASADPV
ncbi:bifunctional phosphatase PAP2/diacylglycerol kinase family protein [Nocardia higoensis]|uniref:bifunctional phosphatase PAP2/diacylglycerol kinase family protein n=1 Tax=Nocardia higoensis TaxID=228599 RepID=UPI000A03BB95|nr:bifunctional phosphatase PAP2/diacylglycerol kinase family protein [Nocardia higoensis]